MTEQSVQVPPDSTGKKIRTVENTVNAVVVEQQVVSLAKSDATLIDDLASGAKQDTGNASLASIDGKLSGALSVTGSTVGIVGNVEVTNDVGNPLPVSGTVTANAGTNLNTSALALEAGNLATLAGKDFATQTTLALIKAKTDNIPADPAREGGNLATSAKQDTGNTSLASLDGKLPAQGQALMSASVPVTLASDQMNFDARSDRGSREMADIRMTDSAVYAYARRAAERMNVTDRRGSVGRGSTR